MNAAERRDWVVARARALGFDLCGVAPAADFDELARLPEWLARGYAGEMRYLHDARRQSPQAAMPGARSIVVCALNYNTALPYSTDARAAALAGRGFSPDKEPTARSADRSAEGRRGAAAGERSVMAPSNSASSAPSAVKPDPPRGWISRYAWGDDYHDVLGAKLEALVAAMRAEFAEPFDARSYVDTGPVVERVAAHHAGLGWLAKNTCLINEQLGSWLFLGLILTSLDIAPSLAHDELPSNHSITQSPNHPIPPPDLCGQCTQCIDACPTGAIVAPYLLDARRCISYLTIELRGPVPDKFHAAMGWHVFGCDICQDVCPFNRRAPTTDAPEFQPRQFSPPIVGALLAAPASETRNSKLENRQPGNFADRNHQIAKSLDHQIPFQSAPSAQSADAWSLFAPPLESLASLTDSDFRTFFRGSAVRRTKHAGLTRNAAIARKNM